MRFFFPLLLLLAAGSVCATDDAVVGQRISKGLEFSYREDYDSATVQFSKAIEEHPGDPAGYFFLCGMYGLYMNDFTTDDVDGPFLINLFQTIWMARKRIEADSSDAWAHFYLGGAYGYRAFREQQRGSKWAALSHALTAVAELKRSVSLDSTLYDAYMGIGSYHYFVNHLWSYVPFLGNDPERGIGEIRLAMERGRFVSVPAQEGLVHILLREKRREEALKLSADLAIRYPNSRTFHWTLAKVYEEMGDWRAAASVYWKLRGMIETGQPENFYNLAYCGHRLSLSLLKSGDREAALGFCQSSLSILEASPKHRDAEKLLKDLRSLLERIQKDGGG